MTVGQLTCPCFVVIAQSLVKNIAANGVQSRVRASNKDAREFVRYETVEGKGGSACDWWVHKA